MGVEDRSIARVSSLHLLALSCHCRSTAMRSQRAMPDTQRSSENGQGGTLSIPALTSLSRSASKLVVSCHSSCCCPSCCWCCCCLCAGCSALKLGHLTALTFLDFDRLLDENRYGWRVPNAGDTPPPNLQQLFVNDCLSATPLLHLAWLKVLRISDHCHMPAAELQRLSTLTQLESLRLGCNTWRRYGGERAAQEASPGWLAVSGVLWSCTCGQWRSMLTVGC